MYAKLGKLSRFLSEGYREPSNCEACGNEFACGATLTGCWCSEIKLSDQTKKELRSQYSGCLCRKCLEGFARQPDEF